MMGFSMGTVGAWSQTMMARLAVVAFIKLSVMMIVVKENVWFDWTIVFFEPMMKF